MIPWGLVAGLTVGGTVANIVAGLFIPFRLSFNLPTFCMICGMFNQLVTLQAIASLAWWDGTAHAGSTLGWLVSDWASGKQWETAWLVVTTANMSKDFAWLLYYHSESPEMGTMLISHHIGAIALMLSCLALEPVGASMFVMSSTGLEIGSGFSSIVELNPTSPGAFWSFYAFMTASNVFAGGLVVLMLALVPLQAWHIVLISSAVFLIYKRQVFAEESRSNFSLYGNALTESPSEATDKSRKNQ